MNYLTEKAIKNKFLKIKNQFNEHLLSEDTIDKYTSIVMYDKEKNKRSRKLKESFLMILINDYKRDFVIEFDNVIVSKGARGSIYYIHIKYKDSIYTPMKIFIDKRKGDKPSKAIKIAKEFEKIEKRGYTECNVEFPSGKIVFSNFFKNKKMDDYAFEMPDQLKYKDLYSINHQLGEQNVMKKLSELHGLGYAQLGNCSASIYKISDNHIIVTTTHPYYEEHGFELELDRQVDWEYLGDICCDVWRIEFIDQENFKKGDALPLDHKEYRYNKPLLTKVNPGIWSVKNRYHYIDDDSELKKGQYPKWVELRRIK